MEDAKCSVASATNRPSEEVKLDIRLLLDSQLLTQDLANVHISANNEKQPVQEKSGEMKKPEGVKKGEGHQKLYSWLNKNMKIEMTDGRVLIGVFLCTDRDGNVILGSCSEYINPEVCGFTDEPRILGLVMVPGRHIVSIHHDAGPPQTNDGTLWGSAAFLRNPKESKPDTSDLLDS